MSRHNNGKKLRVLTLALLLAGSPIQAQDPLELAGLAVYTETARDIYLAGLRVVPDTGLDNIYLAPGPKAMQYRIATRRISSRGFFGTLLLQAEMGSGEHTPNHVIGVLNDLKRNVKSAFTQGDQFEILLSEEDSTHFSLNGTELLRVADGTVFDFFFVGWVGENSSALFRKSLLAGSIDKAYLARYESLAPSAERNELVAGWIAPTETEVEAAALEQAEQEQEQEQEQAEALAAKAKQEAELEAQRIARAAAEAAAEAAEVQRLLALAKKENETAGMDDREYQLQLKTYLSQVMNQVTSMVVYPRRAVNRNRQGTVELLASLDEQGELLNVALNISSGHGTLDKAAEEAVIEAAPYPPLTPVARQEFATDGGEPYVVTIPVSFRLQE